MIVSHSPFTNRRTATYDYLSNEDLSSKITIAHNSFRSHRLTTLAERSASMVKVADALLERKYEMAEVISNEMGKLIAESLAEVEKCAWVCKYYAEHASEFLGEKPISSDASYSAVTFQPLGVILGIMPWNFPFWQVFRFAVPTILSGNTVLLKHASNVPRCAEAIEQIFSEGKWSTEVYQNLFITHDQASDLIKDDRVRGVSLTGSEAAGKSVAQLAGAQLKPCVLELGGSDPYIILSDADLELAVDQCIKGRLLNAGQSCIGAKRFIVVKDIYDEFMSKFRKGMEAVSFGDPLNNKTTLAPLSSFKQRDILHEQVLRAVKHGAHLLIGGYVPNEIEGAFYPATILLEVQPDNPIYNEELFGPVAMVFRADDTAHALELANDSNFGLGAAIFSEDETHAIALAKQTLEAGSCFVNSQVKSDPRLPFGGIKNSGYGRELSMEGIRAFTNIKTIYQK